MSAYFLDSSAAVKKYVREIGTGWLFSLFREKPANTFYVAEITAAEVASARARRFRGLSLTAKQAGQAKKRFERDFQRKFFRIDIDAQIVGEAAKLAEKHFLRGYDAVQLAAALKADNDRIAVGGSKLIFVCADNALRLAASAEGLTVDDPNSHP